MKVLKDRDGDLWFEHAGGFVLSGNGSPDTREMIEAEWGPVIEGTIEFTADGA